jgi:hypothetical protein
MRGLICNKDVAANLGLIWREFGCRCALRCLGAVLSGTETTFLDVAFGTDQARRRPRPHSNNPIASAMAPAPAAP